MCACETHHEELKSTYTISPTIRTIKYGSLPSPVVQASSSSSSVQFCLASVMSRVRRITSCTSSPYRLVRHHFFFSEQARGHPSSYPSSGLLPCGSSLPRHWSSRPLALRVALHPVLLFQFFSVRLLSVSARFGPFHFSLFSFQLLASVLASVLPLSLTSPLCAHLFRFGSWLGFDSVSFWFQNLSPKEIVL